MPPATESGDPRRPRARPDLVFRRVGEEWVIFDADGQRLYVLNLAAALVWSHCTGELDAQGIEQAVVDAFGGRPRRPGVADILEQFRAADLLVG